MSRIKNFQQDHESLAKTNLVKMKLDPNFKFDGFVQFPVILFAFGSVSRPKRFVMFFDLANRSGNGCTASILRLT